MTERCAAVVVAAGQSRRFGQDKLFVELAGEPVLARALRAFQECPAIEEVALVLGEANAERGRALVVERGLTKVRRLCRGGARRQDSVLAGLEALAGVDWVAIHDGARPLVTPELVARGLAAARETGAAVPGIPLKDTVKLVDDADLVVGTPPRPRLRAIQTPQVFRYALILDAYRRGQAEVTDDAALLEALGHPVKVYPGADDNLKVTTAEDLDLAAALLGRRRG